MKITRIEKCIFFKEKFAQHLANMRKTATMRLGFRIPENFVLPIVITETKENLGKAEIDFVAWLRFKEIKKYPSLLIREYPSNYKKLFTEMKMIYPKINSNSWVTYYGFKVMR